MAFGASLFRTGLPLAMRRSQLLRARFKAPKAAAQPVPMDVENVENGVAKPQAEEAAAADSKPKPEENPNNNDELPPPPPVLKRRRAFKAPLLSRKLPKAGQHHTPSSNGGAKPQKEEESAKERYFTALYCKRSSKKHKTYDDAVVVVRKRKCWLKTVENKDLVAGRILSFDTSHFGSGSEFDIGNWEVEIQNTISEEDYLAGRCFVRAATVSTSTAPAAPQRKKKKSKKQSMGTGLLNLRPGSAISAMGTSSFSSSLSSAAAAAAAAAAAGDDDDEPPPFPTEESALVLNRHREGSGEFPVRVENHLSSKLRPHQIEGVKFLYRCVANPETSYCGAILADEMGLGKTLQTITLIYTLLKCGPVSGAPLLRKAIIVCPSSLVGNWEKQFRKWLGSVRIKPISIKPEQSAAEQREHVRDFCSSRTRNVVIVSYELLRKHVEQLERLQRTIVVCDEGHRLKNSKGNQTIRALKSISTRRRIILTGTPVQNDLMEFFAMCDYVNPGILGDAATFRNTFEMPIAASREPHCEPQAKKIGDARSKELSRTTNEFVLRRTSEIMQKFLPPKTETIVFCSMGDVQRQVYTHLLKGARRHLTGTQASALACITLLKKACNHPLLVHPERCTSASEETRDVVEGLLPVFEAAAAADDAATASQSGKMDCLMRILAATMTLTSDKTVVVSNYTETLDVVAGLCQERGWKILRLDGRTPQNQRMPAVERFNASFNDQERIFLLSAKAGGTGLDLVGANRLVLFDCDWNPATDLQAMARVWRDGQKKDVFITRLMCTGTIDEKIFQRQLRKAEVADAVVDEKFDVGRSFSKEDLKRLFEYRDDTKCDTIDIMEEVDAVWETEDTPERVPDAVLRKVGDDTSSSGADAGGRPLITFVMHKTSEYEEPVDEEANSGGSSPLLDEEEEEEEEEGEAVVEEKEEEEEEEDDVFE